MDMPISDLKNEIDKKDINFSRIPIYYGNKNNVVGYIKVSDLIGENGYKKLYTILRPILITDSDLDIEKLLKSISRFSSETQVGSLSIVLIMDIVGYSNYTNDEQKKMIITLQKIIKSNPIIKNNIEDIKFLPTGDGCVISLKDTLFGYSIRLCADLQKSMKKKDLEVRYGLNLGHTFTYQDISNNLNIAGAGINIAARAMDIGDANHIIANQTIKGIMSNIDPWHKSVFHDLGEVVVKHGLPLRVFNIYSEEEEFGNPELPLRCKEK